MCSTMFLAGRLQKRSAVQWFLEVDCKNGWHHIGVRKSTARSKNLRAVKKNPSGENCERVTIFSRTRPKQPTVQWLREAESKNDQLCNGFGRSTAKTNHSTMVLGSRQQKRLIVQWFGEVDCKNDRQYNGFGRWTVNPTDGLMVFGGRRVLHILARRRRGGRRFHWRDDDGGGKAVSQARRRRVGWSSPKPRETRKGRRLAYYPVKCVRKRTKSLALARSAKASDHSDFRVAGHPVKFVSCIHF